MSGGYKQYRVNRTFGGSYAVYESDVVDDVAYATAAVAGNLIGASLNGLRRLAQQRKNRAIEQAGERIDRALEQGEFGQATRYFEECLKLHRTLDNQQGVARAMSQRVVDGLEVVQIEEQHCHAAIGGADHGAFQALGKEPDESPFLPIEGIEKQGQIKLKLADESIKDHVILAGCAETEHLEIAVYENLIVHAGAMGHEDVVALLRENLEQEQHTLGEVLRATLAHAQREAVASR